MKDLTQGSATKHIITFSVPLLLGLILQQLYGIVDSIIVGRYLGGQALAAVASAGSVMHFLIAVTVGFTSGGSVLISQLFGAKQEKMLERAVSTIVCTVLSVCLVISALSVIAMPLFMRALGVPYDIFDNAVLYMRIIMGGMFFTVTYNLFAAFLRALGDTKRPLYILMFSTVLNIGLSLFFVLVLGMGVAGVALTTVISQAASAVICYAYILRSVALLRIKKFYFDRLLFRAFIRYSIPAAIQYSMTSFANMTIMRLVNSFGSMVVAGYAAALRIDAFALVTMDSLSIAVSTFAAQNIGADQEKRARQGAYNGFVMTSIVAIIVSGTILLFRHSFVSIFIDTASPDGAQIISIGAQYLSVLAWFYIIYGWFFILNGFFRGVGNPEIVLILTVISMTMRSVIAHLLVHYQGFGIEAVAMSIPIGWGLCSAYGVYHFISRKWAGKSAVKKFQLPLEDTGDIQEST